MGCCSNAHNYFFCRDLLCTTTGAVADERPSFLSIPREKDLQLNIGKRLEWCVSGGSLGVQDLKWAWSLEPNLETVNISAGVSDQPCLDCGCAESNYYSSSVVQEYLQNRTVGGARGMAFSVLGYKVPGGRQFAKNWQCSGVPTNFLSFVIIDKVDSGDNSTEMKFNVVSFTGDNTQGNYRIHAGMCFI